MEVCGGPLLHHPWYHACFFARPLLSARSQAKSTELEAATASVRLQVGRIALWSLLQQARRHRAIPDAVVAACADLTEHLVEPELEEAASAAAGAADTKLRTPWSQAWPRIEVFPALLHLMARSRLDALLEDESQGQVSTAPSQSGVVNSN